MRLDEQSRNRVGFVLSGIILSGVPRNKAATDVVFVYSGTGLQLNDCVPRNGLRWSGVCVQRDWAATEWLCTAAQAAVEGCLYSAKQGGNRVLFYSAVTGLQLRGFWVQRNTAATER